MTNRGAVRTDVGLPSRYRVQRVLGSGGMATVYLAEDDVTNGTVAVKVLKPELASAVATDRFLREIEVVRLLHHPNILSLLDTGEADGVPYYVMPWVDGESLRHRLERERQLPVDEAIRLARALADALDAAHRSGVVHRDVKPENVLLAGSQVFLADFGVARALSQASGERLTDSGLAIGTPGYMSPEQASGEREVDARSDVYSLGCVVFEMLAGEAPYTGPSAQAVVAKQLSLPVPSLTIVRDGVSEVIDDVLRRALAKVPADRYQSPGRFIDALETAARTRSTSLHRLTRGVRRHPLRVGVGIAIAVAVLAGARLVIRASRDTRGQLMPADTLRYAVLPFARRGVAAEAVAEDERAVRDALTWWADISVIDDAAVADVVGARSDGLFTRATAAAFARTLRSGRYIRGEVSGTVDRREVQIRLYDALKGDSVLAEATARLDGSTRLDTVSAALVDSLVLRTFVAGAIGKRGTRSLAASQAFGRGQSAIAEWNLPRADTGFATAARLDPQYARGQLWLALARLWAGGDAARYRLAADQAVLGGDRLSDQERVMARAAQAHGRGELNVACPLWRSLTRRDSLDAFAWYGSAYCLTSDDVVVPDGSSPSGWRFRTSYNQALRDYETAFRLYPPMLAAFGGGAFDALGRLFKTGASLLRQGRAASPDARRFSSSMEWSHDTLAFVPYVWGGDHPDHLIRRVDALAEAVRHQRALVRDVASTWVASFPDNPDAWVALALSLAALGESAALDTVAHARAIARTDLERMRAAGANVAMQVAYAVRDGDTLRLRRAKALADSLLDRGSTRDADAVLLTSLAALTGRAAVAAQYSRARSVAEAFTVPDALRDGTATLLVLSALGGPADSLAVIERRVSDLITRGISPTERLGRRLEFLARAASMAFPRYRFEGLDSLASDGDALVMLESRSVRGDSAGVRRGLAAFKAARRSALPEHLALDALTPEAALLSGLRDATEVIAWLAPTLRSLPQMQPGLLSSPVRAGSLPHALLMHARAEATIGDRAAARRSAAAVAILWSNADAFLQPLVEEARRLAR